MAPKADNGTDLTDEQRATFGPQRAHFNPIADLELNSFESGTVLRSAELHHPVDPSCTKHNTLRPADALKAGASGGQKHVGSAGSRWRAFFRSIVYFVDRCRPGVKPLCGHQDAALGLVRDLIK